MAGNTFGEIFKITTFGESHGKAIGVVIDGLRPNVPIDLEDIQKELDRRKPGQSDITTPRKEEDKVEILSGIFNGRTTGTPICMIVWNKDQDPKVYENYKNIFRPGHAGYTFLKKYGIYDYYGGGRASGRETAARVAAGAIAKNILKDSGIEILAYTKQIGNIEAKKYDYSFIEKNPVRCPDRLASIKMQKLIKKVRDSGDSIGGIIEILIKNCPVGIGDPVFDKLNAEIGKALLSIGAVKGFEMGEGFKVVSFLGSQFNDQFYYSKQTKTVKTKTNHQGGILAGISDGEDIICRVAVKPTSSISRKQKTLNSKMEEVEISIKGRHDPCLCPRIVPIAEAMVALVLLDRIMIQEMIIEKNELTDLRKMIDIIDKNILFLLSMRKGASLKIGKIKRQHKLSIFDKKREKDALKDRTSLSKKINLNNTFVSQLFQMIFSESKRIQKNINFKK
jgi:chorismate synthase